MKGCGQLSCDGHPLVPQPRAEPSLPLPPRGASGTMGAISTRAIRWVLKHHGHTNKETRVWVKRLWCVWRGVVWCGVGCGVWCLCGSDDSEHAVSVQGHAYVQLIGWQNTWEQAPGVPATPSPHRWRGSAWPCTCVHGLKKRHASGHVTNLSKRRKLKRETSTICSRI